MATKRPAKKKPAAKPVDISKRAPLAIHPMQIETVQKVQRAMNCGRFAIFMFRIENGRIHFDRTMDDVQVADFDIITKMVEDDLAAVKKALLK